MKATRRGFLGFMAAGAAALKGLLPAFAKAAPTAATSVIPLWPEIGYAGEKTFPSTAGLGIKCHVLHTQRGGEVFYGTYQERLVAHDVSPGDGRVYRTTEAELRQSNKDRREGTEEDLRKFIGEYVFSGCSGPKHQFDVDLSDPFVSGKCRNCRAWKWENFTVNSDMLARMARALRNEGWPGY